MPHLSMEYSANLDEAVDFDGLCASLHAAVLGTGLFELGAVRVRAVRCDHFAIADLLPDNGFIDMSFRIGAGRSDEEKRLVGAAIMAMAEARLSEPLAKPHFALSLEIREIDSRLSWKTNTIHTRLRNRTL